MSDQISSQLAHLSGVVEGLSNTIEDFTKVTRKQLDAHDTRMRDCETNVAAKPSRAEIWMTTGGVGAMFTALIAFVSHLKGS